MVSGHCKLWYAWLYRRVLSLIIIYSLILFVLSTEGDFESQHQTLYFASETITSIMFLIDYIIKLAVAPEKERYGRLGPVWGRLRYCVSVR